jgi:molybdate transport system regulatory protein
MVKACLRIRVDFEEGTILSPGKVRLLEMVEQCGSIEDAAAAILMELDRAQLVVRQLEGLFGGPLVERQDGSDARRVRLTGLGRKVVERYRETERVSALAADRLLAELTSLVPDRHGSDTGSV